MVGVIALSFAVLIILLPRFTPAHASQQVSFRLSRLETENRMLRSRLSQLETQIDRISRTSGVRMPEPSPPPAVGDLETSPLANDPMFDRLATLVIETRQDVFALQEQVEALESQLPSSQP